MHRARAAKRRAASEFGPRHVEVVAQDPEERGVFRSVDLGGFAVQLQRGHGFLHMLFFGYRGNTLLRAKPKVNER